MRITLTSFYNMQASQNKELSEALGEIKTAIAVILKGNSPIEADLKKLKVDVVELQRKLWQIPSIATLISVAGLVIAVLALNTK